MDAPKPPVHPPGDEDVSSDGDNSDLDLGGDDSDDDEVLQDMMRYDSVEEVARVLQSTALQGLLERLETAMAEKGEEDTMAVGSAPYLLLQDCNAMVRSIASDTRKTSKFMIDHYHKHLPELEQMIPDPVLYAKVALAVRNRNDGESIKKDLEGVLEQKLLLSLMYALPRKKDTFGEEEWQRVESAAQMTLQLEEVRESLMEYVTSRMGKVAPNVSALVGANVASQLVCAAGGLESLGKLHSNIIRMLGKKKRSSTTASAAETLHAGSISQCDLVQAIPPTLPKDRRRIATVVADKIALCVRMDVQSGSTDTSYAEKLRGDIMKKAESMRRLTAGPEREKALKAPDDRTGKKKRGGRKAQRAKQKFRQSELSQDMNRMELGKLHEGDDMGEETVYTGGKRRLGAAPESVMPPRKQKRSERTAAKQASRVSGISTTMAFTPVEDSDSVAFTDTSASLADPNSGSRYFGTASAFQV